MVDVWDAGLACDLDVGVDLDVDMDMDMTIMLRWFLGWRVMGWIRIPSSTNTLVCLGVFVAHLDLDLDVRLMVDG